MRQAASRLASREKVWVVQNGRFSREGGWGKEVTSKIKERIRPGLHLFSQKGPRVIVLQMTLLVLIRKFQIDP